MSTGLAQEIARSLQTLESGRSDVWYLRGYIVFHCLFALSEINFLSELSLKGSLDIQSFAKEKQLDPDGLEAVARYLYGLGILDRDGQGRYTAAAEILEADIATIEMFYAYDPLFHNLSQVLKKEKKYGVDINRFAELDARATAKICKNFSYPKIIQVIESRGVECVMDLGCGSAELLIELCKRNPGVRAYGIDIASEAVRYAQERVAREGLEDRIKIFAGDILNLESILPDKEKKQVDLIVSAAVFHEFAYESTDGLIKALKAIRRWFPGTELILSEALEQADQDLRQEPTFVLEHHLFHRLSLQGIASLERWRESFNRAGYRLIEEISLGPGGMIFSLK